MSQPLPSQDPAASWRQVRASLEAGQDEGDALPWKRIVLAVVTELGEGGVDRLFWLKRVGDRLVLCVLEGGEAADEPRVTLTFLPEDQTVKVAYGRGDIEAKAPMIEAWVSAAVAVQVTMGGLRRLWTESKPGAPMPEALQER